MIKGIGCDIVEIGRVERLTGVPRFLEKVYTPCERERIACGGSQTAAGIWAAKEAAAKALGTGFSGFALRDIEILHAESGAPFVRLHGGAQRRLDALGGDSIHISISHDQHSAIAFAVAE